MVETNGTGYDARASVVGGPADVSAGLPALAPGSESALSPWGRLAALAPAPCGRGSVNQVQTAALTHPAQVSHHRRKSQEKLGQDRTQEAVTEVFHLLTA